MKNAFDASEGLPQDPSAVVHPNLELNHQQCEIHQNLKTIGPEIAAYYLDGLKILHSFVFHNKSLLVGAISESR